MERHRRTAEIAELLSEFIHPRPNQNRDVGIVETLVATILSQNTSDANSRPAYLALREHYRNWNDLAAADTDELAGVIRQAGLAHIKARTIVETLRGIREQYGGYDLEGLNALDDDELLNTLTSYRGVGIKTAACVAMFAMGRDICPVDTHVHRITNRLGIVRTSTPEKTFRELRTLLPKNRAREVHVDMLLFGRRICKAQRPHCFECPLYDVCEWEEKEERASERISGAEPISGDILLLDIIHEGRAVVDPSSSPRTLRKQSR